MLCRQSQAQVNRYVSPLRSTHIIRPQSSYSETPAVPETPFPPRPQPSTVSSTAKLSQRSASVVMETVPPTTASAPTFAPLPSPPPTSVPPAASGTPSVTAVSRAPSAPTAMPPHVRREVERAASFPSVPPVSSPQVQVSSGVAFPAPVPLLNPFSVPVLGTSRPTELYNPYDSLLAAAEVPLVASVMRSTSVQSTGHSELSASSEVPPVSTSAHSMSAETPFAEAGTSSAVTTFITTVEPAPASGSSTGLLELGPNGYPMEKKEVRMEPPYHGLRAVNADTPGSSSKTALEEHLDAPPAYGM